jgi:DNA-binding transcriptional LysR family regulator
MYIRQLEYLVALSRTGHFGQAAEQCHVSQSGLSNAIRQLEEELGVPVVLRHQRFQGFTTEGLRVVEWAKRLVADRNAMLQELSMLQRNLIGRLRIGAMPNCSPILPFITRRFTEMYPAIRVNISFLGVDELRRKLTSFDLDAGLGYLDPDDPGLLAVRPLYREQLGLLVPDEPGFPELESITWSEAAALPLCLLPSSMEERRVVDSAFAEAGVEAVPRIESDSIVNLAFHVMHGGFVTVMAHHFHHVAGAFPGTRMLRLDSPAIVRQVGLLWVANEPVLPMVRALHTTLNQMETNGELLSLAGAEAIVEFS